MLLNGAQFPFYKIQKSSSDWLDSNVNILNITEPCTKNDVDGNSLAVQWLGVRTFTAVDLHLIRGGETKTL